MLHGVLCNSKLGYTLWHAALSALYAAILRDASCILLVDRSAHFDRMRCMMQRSTWWEDAKDVESVDSWRR